MKLLSLRVAALYYTSLDDSRSRCLNDMPCCMTDGDLFPRRAAAHQAKSTSTKVGGLYS